MRAACSSLTHPHPARPPLALSASQQASLGRQSQSQAATPLAGSPKKTRPCRRKDEGRHEKQKRRKKGGSGARQQRRCWHGVCQARSCCSQPARLCAAQRCQRTVLLCAAPPLWTRCAHRTHHKRVPPKLHNGHTQHAPARGEGRGRRSMHAREAHRHSCGRTGSAPRACLNDACCAFPLPALWSSLKPLTRCALISPARAPAPATGGRG